MNKLLLAALVTLIAQLASMSCSPDQRTNPLLEITSPLPYRDQDIYPSWCPTGDLIAYTHIAEFMPPESLVQVWIYDLSDSSRRYLALGSQPAWTPDGQSVVFVRSTQLYRIEIDSPVPVHIPTPGPVASPAVSPDGETLAFYGTVLSMAASGLWTSQLDGTDARRLLFHDGRYPTWSPSGDSLLVVAALASTSPYDELLLFPSADSQSVRMTDNTRLETQPDWSRSTGRIAWASYGDNATTGIWWSTPDWSHAERIFTFGANPSWSSDGTRIAFEAVSESARAVVLWVGSADGSAASPLP